MAEKQETKTYCASMEEVCNAVDRACSDLKWTVVSGGPEQAQMEIKSGGTVLCPLGIVMNISLTAVEPGKTGVMVCGKSKGQVIDYGQTNKDIRRLFEVLDGVVTPVEGAQPVVCNPSQSGACNKCGNTLSQDARFCGVCGTPVENK